jgi:hypothetical protein
MYLHEADALGCGPGVQTNLSQIRSSSSFGILAQLFSGHRCGRFTGVRRVVDNYLA